MDFDNIITTAINILVTENKIILKTKHIRQAINQLYPQNAQAVNVIDLGTQSLIYFTGTANAKKASNHKDIFDRIKSNPTWPAHCKISIYTVIYFYYTYGSL